MHQIAVRRVELQQIEVRLARIGGRLAEIRHDLFDLGDGELARRRGLFAIDAAILRAQRGTRTGGDSRGRDRRFAFRLHAVVRNAAGVP